MNASNPDELLTEDWLSQHGFRWHQDAQQLSRHWVLWIGEAQATCGRSLGSSGTDFGLELSRSLSAEGVFLLWFRSDYAGRYSRFLFAREVQTVGQLVRVIESLTDLPWNPGNALYGTYRRPEQAQRLREEMERLDWQVARSGAKGYGEEDETKARLKG